jgi:hypothetical protein
MELIPSKTREADLLLTAITISSTFQVRCLRNHNGLLINTETVDDYQELLADGVDLGPLEVIEEIDDQGQPTGRFLLADGHHRWEAHRRLKHETVHCRIRQGDDLTALLLAASANGGRGLRFGLADRKKVAEMLLKALAKRGLTWSNEQIASHAGIHRSTVAQVRADINSRFTIPDTRQVVRGNQTYTMTPGQPRAYQIDELLDTMPTADRYIEPPAQKQSSRPPFRAQAHSARQPMSSSEYHAPTFPSRLQQEPLGTAQNDKAPPSAEDRLFEQLLMASGVVPSADGFTFVLGWRLSQAGNVQLQGFEGPMTPADELHKELYTALLDWLGERSKGQV